VEDSMKIDAHKTPENRGKGRGAQHVQESGAAAPRDEAAEGGTTRSSGKVNISLRSKELSEIIAVISRLPDVRETRVAELKRQVEAGIYIIDTRRVAEKMWEEL
jgi:flagellar biosynthesis anti-sigma factor FlgM